MTDALIEWVTALMSSPWIYLVLFALSAVDGFFPVVPSESVVITAGVFAAADGVPSVPLVILVAALGAAVGDHVSYGFGRLAGPRIRRRAGPTSRRGKSLDAASRMLESRGGLAIVVARYIPGGRTAVTLTAGAVAFSRARFTAFDALAASSWAVYSVLIGYLGGRVFEDDPVSGFLLGLGIAVSVTVVVEVTRYVRRRRSASSRPPRPQSAPRRRPPDRRWRP